MINIIEQKMKVQASQTDIHAQFGLVPALAVAQDNMCEFFDAIKCDGIHMIPACNCFFVLTKSRIKFSKFIDWLESFTVKTELVSTTKVRVVLSTNFIDASGEVFAICEQELCAMDATKRSLRMLSTTSFPDSIQSTQNVVMGFDKLSEGFSDKDCVGNIVVDVSNLDFYKHVNNVEFVKFMISTLDLSFVKDIVVEDFEIHYICESRCGDELDVYRKIEENYVCFQVVRGGCVIAKAKLTYKKR